jgi:hypothetical protein
VPRAAPSPGPPSLTVRPRLSLRRFLPIATLFTGGFGVYYLYVSMLALGRGNRPFALFYAVYGLGGILLAVSLWRARRQLPPPAP